ncbi:MAG: alpha/beta hydrolase, partial [Bacteroidetes bacterium]
MDTELDYLGNGFKNIKINLPNDIDGEQHATLIYRKANTDSNKAVLYVHGFIDYFYQTELADKFNEWGYNFYAVDLRKYGRSLMPHQHPNFISDIKDYFVEFDKSIEIIKSQNNS